MENYDFIVIDVTNGKPEGKGLKSFRTRPRVGEYIDFNPHEEGGSNPDEWARAWKVLAVLHPSSPSSNCGDIYVREAGETLDLRKSLEQGLEATVKYSVEIQAPDHFEDPPVLKLESNKPPMPINVGDLINLRNYSRALETADCTLVEVSRVEHIFGDSQERDDRWTRHRIVVFTKTAPDRGDSRVPGYPG